MSSPELRCADRTQPESGSLLARAAQGDREAFACFYERTSALAYGLALRLLRDRQTAEDAVLDAYLQAWETAGTYRAELGRAEAWILMLVRSRSLDASRRRARRRGLETDRTDDLVLPDAADGPAELGERREAHGALHAALASLPEEQRVALHLAYFEGLTHSEVAARLDLPLGTVKTRIRLGTRRLRDQFDAGEAREVER